MDRSQVPPCLDKALDHARQAIVLPLRSTAYADNLVQVYFQRGVSELAIGWVTRGVKLAPP